MFKLSSIWRRKNTGWNRRGAWSAYGRWFMLAMQSSPSPARNWMLLDASKRFRESLVAYSTTGKLKNFRYGVGEIKVQRPGLDTVEEVESLHELVTDLGPLASYLAKADLLLPADQPWIVKMQA